MDWLIDTPFLTNERAGFFYSHEEVTTDFSH